MRAAAALLVVALAAAGCAREPRRAPLPEQPVGVPPATAPVPRAEPRATRGNPPFYDVEGQRYYVLPSADGYVERGIASWYGADFHGRRTATGEPYDMRALTGAHPTLPLPAWVRVTNLQNGRSVLVRLNDRGPFRRNRIIDLSQAAAEQIDMIREGTALVEVRSVAVATTAPTGVAPAGTAAVVPPPAAPARRFFAQAGAFADPANAQRLAARLRGAGLGPVTIVPVVLDGRRLQRVRVGPVATVGEFDQLIEALQRAGIEAPRLALD
ncbi:MAG: septal ring lytic transglycosylase RlpA family protein [Gammaproteobacteria bacterium]|nr:septal ring lytic transglycosylase RlpA family protein [Gammaproteobacteria bacterium]